MTTDHRTDPDSLGPFQKYEDVETMPTDNQPAPADLCLDCGHSKDDSTMHHDAPGTNWGAALHWFRSAAPAQPVPASKLQICDEPMGYSGNLPVYCSRFKGHIGEHAPHLDAPVPAAQPPTRLTDEEYARELSMDQIEEIFQSWRKQIEKDRTAFLLWTNLLEDLRMAARKVGS